MYSDSNQFSVSVKNFLCTMNVFVLSLLGYWQVHHIIIALKLTKHNLVGVVGSDSRGWQTCKGKFSGELWGKLQRFTFPHKVYKINLPFRRDDSSLVHSLSILKTFLISRKCLCCEGEFCEVAKQWQSAGMNKKIIWPFEFTVLLTVFWKQIGGLWEWMCCSLLKGS